MNKTLAIFDMDGTILDTLEDLYITLNHALREGGYPERSFDAVRRFVGNGIAVLCKKGLPEGASESEIELTVKRFSEYYKEHMNDNTRPYKGITEAIALLKSKGFKTAVVSNKSDAPVKALAENFFPGLFDMAVGVNDRMEKKPAPDMAEYVISSLCMEKADAVYIGDSEVDYQTAVNSDVDFVGVSWGFRGRRYLEELGAKCVIDRPDELIDVLLPH